MTLRFTADIANTILKPVLISGSPTIDHAHQRFLLSYENEELTGIYEIRYQTHCSPFEQAVKIDNLLAVGHEKHFYLFNLATAENLLTMEMEGYFGHLYCDKDLFYVADACGLNCIDKSGNICWTNSNLAIDGVIVDQFTEDKILGSGEWDPPGGWKNFTLHKRTGIEIQ